MIIINYLTHIYDELKNNEDYLNELDAAIGDGDFGSNIVQGFKNLLPYAKKEFTASSSLAVDLMKTSDFLLTNVKGNLGPLLATAFMQMSLSIKNKSEIKNSTFASALDSAFNGIKSLGKVQLGDKTILDALHPAIEAFKQAKDSEPLAFEQAYLKAKLGAEKAMNYKAQKGRAAYLGERSIGHTDPGSEAIVLIFKALKEA